jgi:hypothetical protein
VNLRRVTPFVLVAVAIGAIVYADDGVRSDAPPTFSVFDSAGTPVVPGDESSITTSWFCGGTSAAGDSGSGLYSGEIVLSNPTDVAVQGTVTVLTADGEPVESPVVVDPRGQTVIDVRSLVDSSYASTVVELDSSFVAVEQRALHPAGSAVAPCANATSDEWHFADGFTFDGSDFRLILTNPYLSAAIVNVLVATEDGPRTPSNLQGYVVPARSIRVVNVAEAGFRDEKVLAVSVVAESGRFVAAKDQHYLGGGRLGHINALGAPAASSQWWFADGERGPGVSERYSIYNPTDEVAQASVLVLGLGQVDTALPPASLTVPAHEVVTFDTTTIVGMPDGPHAMLVSSETGSDIVVERVITRPAADYVATTTVLGVMGGYTSERWRIPTSTSIAIEDVLIVLNTSGESGTFTVFSVGPGGEEPVPGLTDVVLGPNSVVSVDLIDPLAFGRPLVVAGDRPLVVERRLERTATLRGRSGSLAFPE